MKRIVIVGAWLLVGVGCHRKNDDVPTTAAPSRTADIEPPEAGVPSWPGWSGQTVTPAMLCQAFYSPAKDLHDRCGRDYDPLASSRGYLEEQLAICVPRVERSLANDRAVIAQDPAKRCIDAQLALRRAARTEIAGTQWEHACDGIFTGKSAPGGKCREDWECGDGYACHGFSPTSLGKCITMAGKGELCTESTLALGHPKSCVAGTYCEGAHCKARDPEGASCTQGSCIEGTFCSTGTHKCTKSLSAAGGVCARHEDCAVGLFCNVDHCFAQKPAGAKCLDSIECAGDCKGSACVARCEK